MKTLSLLLLVVALMLPALAGATTVTITVGDNFYSPLAVTIHPGDVVAWHYQGGSNIHPTASDNGAWATFIINTTSPDNSLAFPTAGSFPYHCTIHGGAGVGMYGTITVAAPLPVQPAQLAAEAFHAYPNPATDVVLLALDQLRATDHNVVQVVNVLGELVRTVEVTPVSLEHELPLSVASLPAGSYACRLVVNNQVIATQRLILSH